MGKNRDQCGGNKTRKSGLIKSMPEPSSQKLPGRVYYISSNQDATVLLALDVTIEGGYVCWFDTIKERIMEIARIADQNTSHFVFKRLDWGDTYTFMPLTLKIYSEKIKQRILVPQDFPDEESMLQAFEKTRKNAW